MSSGYRYSLRMNGLTSTMNTQKHSRPLLELNTVNQVPSGYEVSFRMAGLTSNMNTQKTQKKIDKASLLISGKRWNNTTLCIAKITAS